MSCCICQKTKTTLKCGICQGDLCKGCTQFLDVDTFSFLTAVPADLAHTSYCSPCFEEKVAGELTRYNEMVDAARSILVFDKSQGKETRLIKRLELPVHVAACRDYDEAVLRLAFFAVQSGHNAIIDTDLVAKKEIDGRYQTTVWNGTAIPANVSDAKLIKDRSNWSHPN